MKRLAHYYGITSKPEVGQTITASCGHTEVFAKWRSPKSLAKRTMCGACAVAFANDMMGEGQIIMLKALRKTEQEEGPLPVGFIDMVLGEVLVKYRRPH